MRRRTPMAAGRQLGSALIVASVLAVSVHPGKTQAQSADACVMSPAGIAEDDAAIRSVMAAYNDALNGGKTSAVLPLYADEGVFMPPYSQSAIGRSAVEKAYDAVFDEL